MRSAASRANSLAQDAAPTTAPASADRRLSIAIFGAACLLAMLGLARVALYYPDDAYITLRYVSRLLAGDGLTWNPGERVEGFTHPLWLAQVAALGALGLDLQSATRVLGVAYLAALFALWWRARASPLLLLVLATQPAVVLWAGSGLETVAFAFWIALGAWLVQQALWAAREPAVRRRAVYAGLALAAATLTRPEGFGVAMLAAVLLLAGRGLRPAWLLLAVFGAIVVSYEVFRLAYFGDWLPNTAYVKIGGAHIYSAVLAGLDYIAGFIKVWIAAAIAIGVALACAQGPRPTAMLALTLPLLAAILTAGGDHMIQARFLVPVIVVLTFSAGVAGRRGFRHGTLVLLVVVVVAVVQFARLTSKPVRSDPAELVGEQVGRFLQAHLPAGSLVAVSTAGSTPYFAPSLSFIDMLGLNDRTIAHRTIGEQKTVWQWLPGHGKGDGTYILQRGPDVILLGPADGYSGDDPTHWFLSDYELLTNPEFHDRYERYVFLVPVPLDVARERPYAFLGEREPLLIITAYLRKDSPAAAQLRPSGLPAPRPIVPTADYDAFRRAEADAG